MFGGLTKLLHLSGFSLFPELMKDEALPHLINEVDRLIHKDVVLRAPEPAVNNIRYAESCFTLS